MAADPFSFFPPISGAARSASLIFRSQRATNLSALSRQPRHLIYGNTTRLMRTATVVRDYPVGSPEYIRLDLALKEAERRGVMCAERPEWKDIPDWGDRTDCPLLGLLPEMLDEIFGLPSSLSVCTTLQSGKGCVRQADTA